MESDKDVVVDLPYDAESFAEKHGITVRAAEIILGSNGSSQIACDASARAFAAAVAMRKKQWQRD